MNGGDGAQRIADSLRSVCLFWLVLDVLVFTMIILTVTSCIGYLLHILFLSLGRSKREKKAIGRKKSPCGTFRRT